MTYSDTQPRGTLRYRLLSDALKPSDATLTDPGSWGHEYVRHLAAELGEEYNVREEDELEALPGTIEDLRLLGKKCASFLTQHNAEHDAVDLLEELEIVNEIATIVDENTYSRVCLYMLRCVNLLPPPDDISFLKTVHAIYVQHHKFPKELAVPIRLKDPEFTQEGFNTPRNPVLKRQLASLLARAQIPLEWLHTPFDDNVTSTALTSCRRTSSNA